MALGAAGVMLGTRFVVCDEANSHSGASESDTMHTTLFDVRWENAPHRVLKNQTYEEWCRAGCPSPGQRPGEYEIVRRS